MRLVDMDYPIIRIATFAFAGAVEYRDARLFLLRGGQPASPVKYRLASTPAVQGQRCWQSPAGSAETGVGGVTAATVAPATGLAAGCAVLFCGDAGVGGVTTATVGPAAGLAAGCDVLFCGDGGSAAYGSDGCSRDGMAAGCYGSDGCSRDGTGRRRRRLRIRYSGFRDRRGQRWSSGVLRQDLRSSNTEGW